jgi:hypothetical protein
MPTSWAPEVFVEGQWSRNGLRFATKAEADANALALMMRWTAVDDSRAAEADEPVNYCWHDGKLIAIEQQALVPRQDPCPDQEL